MNYIKQFKNKIMVSNIQKEKADSFLKYHQDKETLVLLNSWDIGSSKLIEACGFKAIATTSMGIAASLGYPDCQVIQLSEMIDAVKGIVNGVKVPVTVDFEAGYGKNLNEIIDSVKKIIETGIVGINIEDSIDLNPVLIDELEFCERISAIRALSDSLGFHLVINARTDSFYTSSASPQEKLSESIKRGNKYREAGADCIFVQPVWDKETISTLVKEINAPVNILSNPANVAGLPPPVRELQDLGVARLSLGSSMLKATLALTKKVADELLENGTYNILLDTLTPLPDTAMAYKMATGEQSRIDKK
ncbi:MAG: isocitrate lyase/phosphoenolpyruvate mutase family protein [Ignavibacteriae bacterium]|nr:isocitrate lyase/phosphoenolpyruvate mutase family protein [Ignavibacteriota bacterium]